MQASATWQGGFRTELTDDRGHRVTVDLPLDEEGSDSGTSALELSVLALAGCIVTIFLMIARRRRVPIEALSVDLEGHRPDGARTIERVDGHVTIETTAVPNEVDTVLRLTLRTCPVGVLFEQAGIPVEVTAVVRPPSSAALPDGASAAQAILASVADR
jgi:putative redox protein